MPRDRHELPVDAEEIGDQIATKHRTHAGRDQGRKTEIDAQAFHLGLIGGTRSGERLRHVLHQSNRKASSVGAELYNRTDLASASVEQGIGA